MKLAAIVISQAEAPAAEPPPAAGITLPDLPADLVPAEDAIIRDERGVRLARVDEPSD